MSGFPSSRASPSARKRLRCGLYFDFSTDNINGEAAAEFLRQLLRHLPGPIIVLWDNVAFHRSRPVKDLLARTTRLHLEAFRPTRRTSIRSSTFGPS
ncbi:MAG: hypothetical protein M5R36_28615 [Deltaproteobacteria bacterium]|nr:hypothetical protein [Deltaproteobacteria bacterium]